MRKISEGEGGGGARKAIEFVDPDKVEGGKYKGSKEGF